MALTPRGERNLAWALIAAGSIGSLLIVLDELFVQPAADVTLLLTFLGLLVAVGFFVRYAMREERTGEGPPERPTRASSGSGT